MTRLRAKANWCFFAAFILLTCVPFSPTAYLQPGHAQVTKRADTLAQDTVRPEIANWSIDGAVSSIASFVVWANVSDSDSGILNVSAVIRRTTNVSLTTWHLMSFNGTFYTATIAPLKANNTYSIWVESYDVALNLAQSYTRTFEVYVSATSRVDPNVTFPIVVGGSVVAFFVALVLSYIYDKRNPRMAPTDVEVQPPDLGQENTQTS